MKYFVCLSSNLIIAANVITSLHDSTLLSKLYLKFYYLISFFHRSEPPLNIYLKTIPPDKSKDFPISPNLNVAISQFKMQPIIFIYIWSGIRAPQSRGLTFSKLGLARSSCTMLSPDIINFHIWETCNASKCKRISSAVQLNYQLQPRCVEWLCATDRPKPKVVDTVAMPDNYEAQQIYQMTNNSICIIW